MNLSEKGTKFFEPVPEAELERLRLLFPWTTVGERRLCWHVAQSQVQGFNLFAVIAIEKGLLTKEQVAEVWKEYLARDETETG